MRQYRTINIGVLSNDMGGYSHGYITGIRYRDLSIFEDATDNPVSQIKELLCRMNPHCTQAQIKNCIIKRDEAVTAILNCGWDIVSTVGHNDGSVDIAFIKEYDDAATEKN